MEIFLPQQRDALPVRLLAQLGSFSGQQKVMPAGDRIVEEVARRRGLLHMDGNHAAQGFISLVARVDRFPPRDPPGDHDRGDGGDGAYLHELPIELLLPPQVTARIEQSSLAGG